METMTVIGLVAAISTTLAFVPQVLTIIKTRNTDGISLGMYTVFTFGVFLWLVYGILAKDLPIIAANAITFILAVTVLALTFYYQKISKRSNSPSVFPNVEDVQVS